MTARVDLDRVYATGLSNGGAMTHRLAGPAAGVFAAATPFASPLSIEPCEEGRPIRPISPQRSVGLTGALALNKRGTRATRRATMPLAECSLLRLGLKGPDIS